MPVLRDDIQRLLDALRQPASSLAADEASRRNCLRVLAQSHEVRAVPSLLHLLPPGNPLSSDAGDTIASLINGISPAQLAWIDLQARNYTYACGHDAWWQLRPDDVVRLAQSVYPSVIGVVASHPSGFVREAAVKELERITDGQEIPFLTLRANDWVPLVASRASELLVDRMVPGNRPALLATLPFLRRMLGQRRREHRSLFTLLGGVLAADGGHDALAVIDTFDGAVRRYVFELLVDTATTASNGGLTAALTDRDPIVRQLAVRRLGTLADARVSGDVLERIVGGDAVPSVRREAMSVLRDLDPDRLCQLLSRSLLDPSAAVREFARFVIRSSKLAVVPYDVYRTAVRTESSRRRLAAAIEGLGETGTLSDLDIVTPFLTTPSPSLRRAALRAVSRLDADQAVSMALSSLTDPSPSVRGFALGMLRANTPRVDFARVRAAGRAIGDATFRQRLLRLLGDAPKWDAALYLLEGLTDDDAAVRGRAAMLIASWIDRFNQSQLAPSPSQLRAIHETLNAVASAMPAATLRELRFLTKME